MQHGGVIPARLAQGVIQANFSGVMCN